MEQSFNEGPAQSHTPATTSEADCCTPQLKTIQDKLPGWIQQIENYVAKICGELQRSYGCPNFPHSMITIEFCLPWKLLIESVDAWPWQTFSPQPIMLGRVHRVVVRSGDRIHNNGGALRYLSVVPEPLSIEQWKKSVDVVKNFNCLKQGDEVQLADNFSQKQLLGLALTCHFCISQHRAEREKLLAALMLAGVPIVVWSRDHTISRLSSTLKTLLTKETLLENE